MKSNFPHKDWRHQVAHFLHVAHSSEAGKRALHRATATATAAAAAVVGTAAAPFVVLGGLVGLGLWAAFKGK